MPTQQRVPSWYKTLVTTLQQHRLQLTSSDTKVTSKQVRIWLTPEIEPRAVRKWRNTTQPQPDFSKAWNLIWHSKSSNRDKELLWLLTHQVLPTRSNLWRSGMNIPPTCPYCADNKDLNHAFILCPRALELWRDLRDLINTLAGQRVLVNIATIAFGHNIPQETTRYELTRFVITTTANVLWSTRNKRCLHANADDGNLHRTVVTKIKKHIELEEFISPSRITNFWSYRDILCSYRQNALQFNI